MSNEAQDASVRRVIRKIPPEIYLEIIQHFGPPLEYKRAMRDMQPDMKSERNRSIRNMALVCRELYLAVFPYLFENIYLSEIIDTDPVISRCARFCESIARGDERALTLATYVKTFVIAGFSLASEHCPLSSASQHIFSLCPSALEAMSNLRELYLFRASITNNLAHATGSLPPLKLLRIEDCDVPEPIHASALRKFASLRITTVYEGETAMHLQDDLATLDLIKNFPFAHTERLSCDRSHCMLFNGIAVMPPLVNLQSLYIRSLRISLYPHALADSLKLMPNLKSLCIHGIEYDFDLHGSRFPIDPLSEFPILPRLEDVYLPVSALKEIVPGTRVSSIGISTEQITWEGTFQHTRESAFWLSTAKSFRNSRQLITSMDIPMRFYLSIPFAVHFPALNKLTVRPTHSNWYEDDMADDAFRGEPDQIIALFLSTWPEHPELTDLEFAYDHPGYSPIREEEDYEEDGTFVMTTVYDEPDDSLIALILRIPTLRNLTFSVGTLSRRGGKILEYFLGKEDASQSLADTS